MKREQNKINIIKREDGKFYVVSEPPRGYTQVLSHGFTKQSEARRWLKSEREEGRVN